MELDLMSSKPPIAYIDIRVFAHATEDQNKVQAAVCNILPTELAETVVFEKSSLTGHHGNSITLYTAKLEEKKLLPDVLRKIAQSLDSLDKEELCQNLKLHMEKSNLYLRLNKQSAFLGSAKFTQTDPIHFKIHFKNKSTAEIEDVCKANGLLP